MYALSAVFNARVPVRAKASGHGRGANARHAGFNARCLPVDGRSRRCVVGPLAFKSPVQTQATRGVAAREVRSTRLYATPEGDADDAWLDNTLVEGTGPAPNNSETEAVGDLSTVADVVAAIKSEVFTSSKETRKASGSKRTYLLALAALIAIHVRDPGWGLWNLLRIGGSLLLGAGLALKGLKSGSLSITGAIGATCVGWGTLYAGVRFGVALGVFFFASSAMTRVGSAVKKKIDEHFVEGKESGARGFGQVAANGGVPTFLALGYCFATGGPEHLLGVLNAFETPLAAAFIGYYACCCGDTWASELGVLSKTKPRMITNFNSVVKPGTNGGVTPLGFVASGAGGFAVGFAFWAGGLLVPLVTGQFELALRFFSQWPVLVVGLAAGFLGSLIDSILGATIQFSGYCENRKRMVSTPGPHVKRVSGVNFLSNSMVNFVSAVVCAAILYFGTIAVGLPRA